MPACEETKLTKGYLSVEWKYFPVVFYYMAVALNEIRICSTSLVMKGVC